MSFLRWAVVTVPAMLFLGLLSGRSVPAGRDNPWYVALAKPALNPPDWAFPVAWALLYVMIGFALALVLHARGARGRGLAVLLFVGQFALNLSWQPVFFGAHRIGIALAIVVAMLVLAIGATLLFGRIRTVAAWLMVPYLAWVSFAGVLTWRIGQLNPGADNLAPTARTSQML